MKALTIAKHRRLVGIILMGLLMATLVLLPTDEAKAVSGIFTDDATDGTPSPTDLRRGFHRCAPPV